DHFGRFDLLEVHFLSVGSVFAPRSPSLLIRPSAVTPSTPSAESCSADRWMTPKAWSTPIKAVATPVSEGLGLLSSARSIEDFLHTVDRMFSRGLAEADAGTHHLLQQTALTAPVMHRAQVQLCLILSGLQTHLSAEPSRALKLIGRILVSARGGVCELKASILI